MDNYKQLQKLAQTPKGLKLLAQMSDPKKAEKMPQRLTHKGEREFDIKDYEWAINAGMLSLDDLNLLNEHGIMAIKDIQNQNTIGAILAYYQVRLEVIHKPLKVTQVVEPCRSHLGKLSDMFNNISINKNTGTAILRVASLVNVPTSKEELDKFVESHIKANDAYKLAPWEVPFYGQRQMNNDEFRQAMKAYGTDTKYLQFTRSLIEKIYSIDTPIGLTNAKLPNHVDGFVDLMPNEYTNGKRYQVWYFVTKPIVTFAIYDFEFRKITDTVKYDMVNDKYMWVFRDANIVSTADTSTTVFEIWESDPIMEVIDSVSQLVIFLVGWYYHTVVSDLYYTELNEDVAKTKVVKKRLDNKLSHIERLDVFYGHNIIVDHDIPVRGHYRKLASKDGSVRLTWVKEHERHGYNRRAGALKTLE